MKKLITANDVFEIEKAINLVTEEHLKLPLNLALKLLKIKREVSEITGYIASRIVEFIPKIGNSDGAELTDQEKVVYSGIMSSPVEIENHDITEENFSEVGEVLVELNIAEKIALLF